VGCPWLLDVCMLRFLYRLHHLLLVSAADPTLAFPLLPASFFWQALALAPMHNETQQMLAQVRAAPMRCVREGVAQDAWSARGKGGNRWRGRFFLRAPF